MLDKFMSRVFGSYKTTVTGICVTLAQVAVQVFVQGEGKFDNKTWWVTALPAVVGAMQKDPKS
jgi:hypothetical protein